MPNNKTLLTVNIEIEPLVIPYNSFLYKMYGANLGLLLYGDVTVMACQYGDLP